MDRLLQTFDAEFVDPEGDRWQVLVYGRNPPGETWQGWLAFVRPRDGATYTTDVETTQPSSEHLVHWAKGLTSTFFDGAFERARQEHHHTPPSNAEHAPLPLRDASADHCTYLARLTALERDILHCFIDRSAKQLETRAVFDALPHANADVVRALEALEKRERLLLRQTEGGTDWLVLTDDGVAATGQSL